MKKYILTEEDIKMLLYGKCPEEMEDGCHEGDEGPVDVAGGLGGDGDDPLGHEAEHVEEKVQLPPQSQLQEESEDVGGDQGVVDDRDLPGGYVVAKGDHEVRSKLWL